MLAIPLSVVIGSLFYWEFGYLCQCQVEVLSVLIKYLLFQENWLDYCQDDINSNYTNLDKSDKDSVLNIQRHWLIIIDYTLKRNEHVSYVCMKEECQKEYWSEPIKYSAKKRCYLYSIQWASYQIRKIADCACAMNAWNIFPATDFKWKR